MHAVQPERRGLSSDLQVAIDRPIPRLRRLYDHLLGSDRLRYLCMC